MCEDYDHGVLHKSKKLKLFWGGGGEELVNTFRVWCSIWECFVL